MRKAIPNKWLYFPVISLFVYFIFRLINQSQIMKIFPLDYTNDYSSYMAQLFFLKECGFHAMCQYWYNGFISFQIYPPGWMFFTYPLYIILGNLQIATFISLILLFIAGFVIIWILGKNNNFSKLERILFFLLYFTNSISIGNFIRLGRTTEMLAWVLFIAFASLLVWYKDNKINKKFIFIPIIFSGIIISHQTTTVLASILFLSMLLVKKTIKERLFVIGSGILSIILSGVWLIPYLINVSATTTLSYALSIWLLGFSGRLIWTNIATFILSLLLWTAFFFYLKEKNNKKREIIFFSPILILNFLFVTRLVILIPILKHVYPDPYMMFFMFFALYFFFKINFEMYSKILKRVIFLSLILLVIINIIFSIVLTPLFPKYTIQDTETLSLLPELEGMTIMLPHPTSYTKAYYSFIPIFYNIPVAGGWTNQIATEDYISKLKQTSNIKEIGCDDFKKIINDLNVINILAYGNDCKILDSCKFELIKDNGGACLYKNVRKD